MSAYPQSYAVDPNGTLSIGGISASELVKTFGSPLYVMDEATLRRNCQLYTHSLRTLYPDFLVVFAGKANLNLGLLNLFAEEGLGVDVVSGGELFTALKSNIPPERMVFHGNNKSSEELEMAIQNHVRIIIDNEAELDLIIQTSTRLNQHTRLLLRLKPEIEAHTHDYIKTGQIDSKFGLRLDQLIPIAKKIKSHAHLELTGIHSHIGSQIFDIEPFEDLADLMATHLAELKSELGIELPELNLGGGIGIQYTQQDDPPSIPDYLQRLTSRLKLACEKFNLKLPKLTVEPGRSLVANAGVTLYTVGSIKSIPGIKDYIFVDGGMADNPRPMLYQSQYTFLNANKMNSKTDKTYAIAGKYCESGDVLTHQATLATTDPGDILAVLGTGAYNYSMASNYNRACRPAMILVGNGQAKPLVRRETYADVMQYDVA